MPRIVVQAEFQAGQAIKDAQNYATQLKAIHAGLPNLGAAPAGAPAAAAAAAGIKAQGQAAQKVTGDFERLNAELKLARSTVATIGLENMSSKGLTQARTEMERIRAEALKLRDSGLPVEQAAKYAGVVSQATAALDKLAAAQRGAAAKAGAKIINFEETKKGEQAVRDLDRALTQLEANRKNGQGNFQAYRAELKRIQDEAFKLSSSPDITAAARAGSAKASIRAAGLGTKADLAETEKFTRAATVLKSLLEAQKITAEQAALGLRNLAARADQLARAQGTGADVAARYGQVVVSSLREANRIDQGVIKTMTANVATLDGVMTRMEANRKAGQGTFAAYQAQLRQIQADALKVSQDATKPEPVRTKAAAVSGRAGTLLSTSEVREAQKYADAVAKVTRLLSENKITADVAQRALAALATRTSQLADAQGVGADAARRYGQVTTAALKEVEKLKTAGSRSFVQEVRELDNTMRILEANRKNGVGTLQTYAQILERIRREAGQKVNDPTLSPAARAAFAGASGRAGGLLAASETAEVKKLTNAVSVLKALLAENKITADQAATGFDNLARRASTAASTLGVSADAAAKFSRALLQAKREAEAARSGGAAVDPGVAAAQAGAARLRELNDQRRSGLITADAYRASVTALGAAMKAEATNTANSAAAQRAFTKAAAEATDALKRQRAEATQNSTGGSLPFSLNSVAFQGGALATGAGAVIGQGLKLNEELVQARLTLESTAKFYKASLADVRNEVKETAVELRQDEATVAQATANLLRKSFSPEMAAETIKRFSDAGTAAGLDATNAIIAASQALLSEQSRQLNSAGIAENLGPELTKMNAAIRAGKEFIGPGNPYRKFYDELRAGGKSVAEATKAVALFQFVMKATDPIAGRTEQSLNSLTGALNNFKVQRDKGLKAIVEGISGVAIPALNSFTQILAYFNNELPASTKNSIGFAVAFTGVGLATAAVGATLLSFGIQQARVLATLPDFIAGNARLAATQRVLNTQLNLGTASMIRHSLATRAAGVSAIFAAGGWVGLAAAIRAAGVAAVVAMPYLLPLTAIAAATVAINDYFAQTVKVYDDIEKMEKENYDARVARDGKEITQAIDKIVLLQGVLGQMRERVDNATTPQEERDALKAVAFTEARIEAERKLIRELRAKRAEENGAAQATDAQAEAYRNLLVQLDAVAQRFGDMKLTTFQKDLRDVSKEQERLLKEIVKGEKEFETSERQSGLTPEQAAKLRKGVAELLPNATRSLVQRELDQYQRDAVDAELETQKARADLLKDGVAQRQVLLKAETAKVKQEYADRIRVVQANQQVEGLTNGQRLAFGQEIERLTAEQADKIKLLEEQAARDLVDIRKERAKKLLDVEKVRLEAELSLLGQVNTALDGERERAVRGTDSQDLEGRLALERQFAARSVELAERTASLQAQIRRRELNAELAENLAAAAELGEGRAAAEAGARAAYRLKEQAAVLESENALNAARLAAEERVQAARAAIVDRWLNERLRGIERVEGAELASLMRTLAATERAYRARGDFESADKVADALKRTQEEAQDRAEKVRSALLDGQKEVDGFNRKLDELTGKASKGLQGARLSAQNPFTTYADSIMEERRKLLELQAKLVNPDAKLQGAITARLRVLEAQERQVRGQGELAANRAAEAFTAAERDKAVKAAAKRAADLYDGGEGDARAYRAALNVERTYWTARLRGLEEGSSEYETAQGRIEEIGRAVLDLNAADARRPVEDARAALELLDAQSALARTDAERLAFLARRLNLLREVAALEAVRSVDPTLKPSDRQAAQVAALRARAEAEEGSRTITAEQRAALESLTRLRDAQVDYALATARSEGQVTAAMKEQVVLAERAVRLQDEEIARLLREGVGERQVTDATAERYRLEVAALEKRRALNRRGFDVDRDVLDLLEAQAKARLALAGIDDDGQVELATARLRVNLLREELAVQGELALVGGDRRSKEKELANVLAGLAQSEEQANEKLRERVRLEREVTDARRRLAFTGAGLDLDEPSGLREQLAQNRVNQERLLLDAAASNDPDAALKSQKELLDLQVEQLTLTRQLEEAERKRQDGLRGARDALAALTDEQRGGSEQSRAELAATRELTGAREALTRAQLEYGRAQAEFLRQPTTASTDRFRAATEALTGAVKRQRDALSSVAGVYTKLAQDMKGVTDSAAKLRGETGLKEEFNGNREIDRFYSMQRRRDRQIRELQDALRRGDVAAITAASTALADQEKSYREQAELLKKNGVNVNLSNTRVVEDLARQVDDLGIQYDREDTALAERARIANQEAQAVDTFAAAVQELGQHTQELLTGIVALPAPAARETQVPVPAEAGSAPLSQTQLRELVAGMVAGIDEARAERLQAATPSQPTGTATTQPQVVTTNNYDTKVYVDGQRFPTVPGVNELVQAVIPPLEAYFADKFRRSGRDC